MDQTTNPTLGATTEQLLREVIDEARALLVDLDEEREREREEQAALVEEIRALATEIRSLVGAA